MKVTYSLTASGEIPYSSAPTPMQVNGIDVEWAIDGKALKGMTLVMHNLDIQPDSATGVIMVRDSARDIVAFRLASFLADSVYALSGVDAFHPQEVFTRAPAIDAETPEENRLLSQAPKRNGLAISVSVALSRPLNGTRIANDQLSRAIAIAHFARALRATDPFEKYEDLYKVVESLAPPDLEGTKLDKWVSGHAEGADSTFTEQRVKQLRELRNRITHPQARLGHLSPHDLQHIQEASANLAEMERLARILIWGTATPWI